ncbi:CdaR family protein [Staphylococcus canis]|uniref:YbbR-like domain-containing protein n=1 Tax=Staphylococcus canis TaxID=2724942 RepID=A0ABS0TB11_9STAP|nr:CdaR family protein [Staphylococcus canis]MBI5975903.1 YbbR-like domain-containing protein [Staphylococcus canis]
MLESKWGLRFFAFVLALLLFLSVNNVFGKTFSTDNIAGEGSKTIKNVPVEIVNQSNDLYVSGAPESVDIELNGPKSKVLQAQKIEDYKVVLDVAGLQIGERAVDFQVNGLDKDINYRVYPKEANLSIEKKETRQIPIEANVSRYSVSPDKKIDTAKVSPSTVKVIGGKEQLDRIAYAKASFSDDHQISDQVTVNAKAAVFDKNMNKLDVQIEPSQVKLSVDVKPYSKKVKIDLSTKGKTQNGTQVSDISLNQEEVEIYGNREDLEDINSIKGVVNVDGISSDTTRDVQLDIPDKVEKIEPEQTQANISIQ